MKYKKIRNSKSGKYRLPIRELKIEADEIPEIDITGEQYLYIDTRHGFLLINAKYSDLRITIHNPTDNKITITKAKKVDMKVEEF